MYQILSSQRSRNWIWVYSFFNPGQRSGSTQAQSGLTRQSR